jgi:hypothetical protein
MAQMFSALFQSHCRTRSYIYTDLASGTHNPRNFFSNFKHKICFTILSQFSSPNSDNLPQLEMCLVGVIDSIACGMWAIFIPVVDNSDYQHKNGSCVSDVRIVAAIPF